MLDERLPPDWKPSDLKFHFSSGRVCLDMLASLGSRSGAAFERWRGTDDLARWCVEAGLLDQAPVVNEADLEAARALREALYRIVQARRGELGPERDDIDLLNSWAARPPPAPQLGPDGCSRHQVSDGTLETALSTVARDAVDLLTGSQVERIRECAEGTCSVLFVDTSRPGKRRWCSMNRCGNKVKKAAFRKRQP